MKSLIMSCAVIVNLLFSVANADSRFGVILISKGSVKLMSATGEEKKSSVGSDVNEGDRLTTGAESAVKIVTMDRNIIVVGATSDIVFEQYRYENEKQKSVVIDVKEGSVRSSIKKKYDQKNEYYNIKTPTSIAGVRGTDFYIEYNRPAKENTVATFEGKVSFKPNESTTGFLVEAGKFIRHKEGQPVAVTTSQPEWVQKTLKTLEVTGKEELPAAASTKSVK